MVIFLNQVKENYNILLEGLYIRALLWNRPYNNYCGAQCSETINQCWSERPISQSDADDNGPNLPKTTQPVSPSPLSVVLEVVRLVPSRAMMREMRPLISSEAG